MYLESCKNDSFLHLVVIVPECSRESEEQCQTELEEECEIEEVEQCSPVSKQTCNSVQKERCDIVEKESLFDSRLQIHPLTTTQHHYF